MTEGAYIKDWRDSLVTKVAAFGFVGLLAFASHELNKYTHEKFCEEYGWLKNRPVAEQIEYANRDFDDCQLGEHMRDFSVRCFLDGLDDCE